jgi:hypothetical protein
MPEAVRALAYHNFRISSPSIDPKKWDAALEVSDDSVVNLLLALRRASQHGEANISTITAIQIQIRNCYSKI